MCRTKNIVVVAWPDRGIEMASHETWFRGIATFLFKLDSKIQNGGNLNIFEVSRF